MDGALHERQAQHRDDEPAAPEDERRANTVGARRPSSSDETGDEQQESGREADGEPTAQDWAAAIDTINYEIVTRLGPRVPRRYLEGA